MDEGIAGTVADWDHRPFSGGYRGLQELADREFSGAVEAAGGWLLYINGRVVGAYEEYVGSDGPEHEPVEMDRFEGASGSAYEAPHDAVPLLLTMQIRGGDVVARDSTKDRPLEEIHRELGSEGFTGYLELSEHVLSGDYYVVYQGGRSMSVAFIGGARRLKTDEEAFERAKKEVGVYEARAGGLQVFDVPEPTETAAVGDAADEDESDDPSADAPTPAAELRDDPVAEPDDAGGDATTTEPGAAASSVADQREATESASGDEGAASSVADQREATENVAGQRDVADGADGAIEDDLTPAVTDIDGEEWSPGGGPDDGVATDESSGVEPVESPVETAAVAQLEERIDRLAEEQAALAATVERLTERLDGVVTDGDGALPATEQRSPAEALAETTLLVRYRSEGETTLEEAHGGSGGRDALAANLRLEPRTPFDGAETAVDGQRYEEFLRGTVEYRFVEWLVEEFPFEVRATGATGALADVYDALPAVDRAEFGQPATEDGNEFDVVLRDREGAPLAVVELHEGAGAPGEATATEFIRRARDTETAAQSLAAGFLVTTGFVDGAVLGPVRDATRSRLLGRDRRKSYVNLSNGGFHLCLVEAGSESFHLAVPDL